MLSQTLIYKYGEGYYPVTVCSNDKVDRVMTFDEGWSKYTDEYVVTSQIIMGHKFVNGKQIWGGPAVTIPLDRITNPELRKALLLNYAKTVHETQKQDLSRVNTTYRDNLKYLRNERTWKKEQALKNKYIQGERFINDINNTHHEELRNLLEDRKDRKQQIWDLKKHALNEVEKLDI